MSKILDATCNASGVVSCDGVTVPAAEVLSEGKQASEGLLFLEGDKARYFPSSATDIKETLSQVSDALGAISSALSALQGGPWAGVPPIIVSQIASITAAKSAIDSLKGALK